MQELPSSATERVLAFRGAYGRLCVLSAQALDAGHHRNDVLKARQGTHAFIDRKLSNIRKQQASANQALADCKRAGATGRRIVDAALEAKSAVEQEWGCKLPIVSDGRIP